jgi:hypothetical protein
MGAWTDRERTEELCAATTGGRKYEGQAQDGA